MEENVCPPFPANHAIRTDFNQAIVETPWPQARFWPLLQTAISFVLETNTNIAEPVTGWNFI